MTHEDIPFLVYIEPEHPNKPHYARFSSEALRLTLEQYEWHIKNRNLVPSFKHYVSLSHWGFHHVI